MATLLDQLGEIASWNSFAASLVAQAKRKPLSAAQVGAAERMLAKLAANAVNREPVAANLSRCHDMFASALGDGMKAPQFRFLWGADEVALSLAKATSRNAGSLYVKLNGEYAGKLSAGVYHPFDMLPQDAADPHDNAGRGAAGMKRLVASVLRLPPHASRLAQATNLACEVAFVVIAILIAALI